MRGNGALPGYLYAIDADNGEYFYGSMLLPS